MTFPVLLSAWLAAAALAQNPEALAQISQAASFAGEAAQKLSDPSLSSVQRAQWEKKRADAVLRVAKAGLNNPRDAAVCLEAGKTLALYGETDTALNFFTVAARAAQETKNSKALGEALTERARIQQKLGNFPAAASDAQAALRLDAGNKTAANIFSLSQGRRAKVNAAPAAAVKTAPVSKPASAASDEESPPEYADDASRAEALAAQAQSRSTAGDHEAALSFIEQARTLQPETPRFYTLAAKLKLLAADYDGALADASEALRRDPKNSEAFFIRARAKETRNYSVADVLADFKTLAAMDKKYAPEYEKAMIRYRRTDGASMDGGLETARSPATPDFDKIKEMTSKFSTRVTRMIYWALFLVVGIPILLALLWWFKKTRERLPEES